MVESAKYLLPLKAEQVGLFSNKIVEVAAPAGWRLVNNKGFELSVRDAQLVFSNGMLASDADPPAPEQPTDKHQHSESHQQPAAQEDIGVPVDVTVDGAAAAAAGKPQVEPDADGSQDVGSAVD